MDFQQMVMLWGNPLFNWKVMKEQDYNWWVDRIAYQTQIYDMLRIDHFRGFDAYYSIPYGDKTARNGEWKEGPGIDLFNVIKEKLGELPIIAEDLGFLTDSVRKLLKDTGFPGMKVLEFAFDSRVRSQDICLISILKTVLYMQEHMIMRQFLDGLIQYQKKMQNMRRNICVFQKQKDIIGE